MLIFVTNFYLRMKTHYFLAIDIGATSGRAIIASIVDGKFDMEEIYRFPNNMLELQGKYYWNIFGLYESIKESLRICVRKQITPDSIGIDTWGVDFGYIAADGSILGLPRSYRDPYTVGAPENFFQHIPKKDVYNSTGIQIMEFNSLFQLFRARQEDFAPLKAAKEILFTPDLLAYMLTGNKVCEYTIASTSQFINPVTKQAEASLLNVAGLSPAILPPIVMPGIKVGELTDALAKEIGIAKIPVIAVAGHDTASAIVAVPATEPGFAYLSSGTWSLMGIEVEEPIITSESFDKNFTNEGGIENTTRFLKNITGMWLLEQCRKEWEREGRTYSYTQITEMATSAIQFPSLVNPDDPAFANPTNMVKAIQTSCEKTGQQIPVSDAEYVACIFNSLAKRYKEVLDMLSDMAPFRIEKLHVIGGGSKNRLLNQLTANAIGLPVVAGPSEATAIGNCMVQAKAMGLVADRWEMRKLITSSFEIETFYPEKI